MKSIVHISCIGMFSCYEILGFKEEEVSETMLGPESFFYTPHNFMNSENSEQTELLTTMLPIILNK